MRYHLTPVRWPLSSNRLQTINADEDVKKREPSCTVGRNVKMEDGMEISLKKKKKKTLGIKLPYDPAFPLLGVYPEETKTEKDIYPNVHCSTVYNI